MSTDLGLDPSDPLNLLLHNTSQNADSSTNGETSQELTNAEDWTKFSALWTEVAEQSSTPMKPYADIMDFADLNSMPMDMDFNPSMSIEPSSLHYDSLKYATSGMGFSYDDQYGLSSELLATQFPFTFQFNGGDMSSSSSSSSSSASPQSSTKERRLSVGSSASSSGASLSPLPESIPSPAPVYNDAVPESVQYEEMPSSYSNDPAAELAHRVRQSAGVMLAVPMNTQIQGQPTQSPMVTSAQSKIPASRVPRHNATNIPKPASPASSSAASTPPPSTPPNSFKLSLNTVPIALAPSSDALPTPTATTPPSALPRPKTSHTTIERRYRTNLNARIQSLRMAVPALRVLEDREGNGKKIKKNVKGSVLIKGTNTGIIDGEDGTVDIIDERGFVDGVKVARKCSKANVLGKAVEYIRVLKKREQRLKAEQAGLKMLVSGLVGGPALVREWEKEWRAKFGGEEKDEVEGEDDDDDEDSDEEEGDEGDEEGGRKRKRAKASTPSATKKPADKKEKKPSPPVVLLGGEHDSSQIPEKRKRGRPRKVLPPPVTLSPNASQDQASSSGVNDEIMHPPTPYSTTQPHWAQQQAQPQQFLLAVFALFSFYNSPLTASSMSKAHHHHTGTVLSATHPPLAYAPEILSYFPPPEVSISNAWTWKEYVQILHLVASLLVLATFLMNWLGISFGFGKAVARGRSMSVHSFRNSPRPSGPLSWLKLGEAAILEGRMPSLSFYERLQIYRSVSSWKNASPSQLATVAMVIQSAPGVLGRIASMKARAIWAAARTKAQTHTPVRVHESLVLALDLDTACALVGRAGEKDKSDGEGEKVFSPIEVLGSLVVKDRIKGHLGKLFVDTVAAEDIWVESVEKEKKEEEREWRKTIDAARELGGHVADLGKMFEAVWKTSSSTVLELEDMELLMDNDSTVDGEIKALLVALVLYRRLFDCGCASPSSSSTFTLSSPPPSPTSKTAVKRAKMMLALRMALGNRVFEDTEEAGAKEVGMGMVQEEMEEEEEEKNEPVMGLEDAKDRVVDLIVELERKERRSSSP